MSEIHIHTDWKPKDIRWDADLAVLVLKSSVKFSNFIQPVCLTVAESINDGYVVNSSSGSL